MISIILCCGSSFAVGGDGSFYSVFGDDSADESTPAEVVSAGGANCDCLDHGVRNASLCIMNSDRNCVAKQCEDDYVMITKTVNGSNPINECIKSQKAGTKCPCGMWPNAKTCKYNKSSVCVPDVCKQGAKKDKAGNCVQGTNMPCDPTDLYATSGKKDGNKCVITKCKKGWEIDAKNNKCILKEGEYCGCPDALSNVKAVKCKVNKNHECSIIAKCQKDYAPSDDGTKCEPVAGDCAVEAQKTDSNVKSAAFNKKKKCVVTECNEGFELADGKCVAEQVKEQDDEKTDSDNAEAVAQPKVSEEEMAELEKNYQDAKAKEQSIGNRLLTTASIATIGAGAQVALTGISEKKADEDAEADMSSYLSSFRCSYTGSKSYKNGEKNIELPGANQLMSLFQEYKSLAADLKERKEALGMKAGIESEVILDKADGGLYDDVGVGITDKHYTSVANALMDTTSEDAKKWNEQKESASKKVKTGAIVAGVGVVGSIVGNELINKVFCKPEDQNAKSGKKEGDICKITKCKDGYELNEADNKCENGKVSDPNEESCTPTDKHAKSGKKEGDVCKIIKCDTDFVPNEDNTKCENSAGDCSEEDLKKVDQYATAGQYFDKQGAKVCKITDCEDGYSVALNKCIEVNNYNAEEESVSGGSNTSGIAAIASKFGGGTRENGISAEALVSLVGQATGE